MNKIKYSVIPKDPYAHLFTVKMEVTPHQVSPITLSLPAWIPGSYMIRDFAKNIVTITVHDKTKQLELNKVDKQTWLVAHQNQPFTIEYDVYAWDLSVRSAHLDQNHGFFNGTSVFLAVEGQEEAPCVVQIDIPMGDQYQHWKIATGLKRADDTAIFSSGIYLANNYQQLIDCPVEMADFTHSSFECHGITHYLIFTGKNFGDMQRVTRDVKALCDHHLSLFKVTPDISEYWFLTYITDNGFGGLEHLNSTALICSRFDLPSVNYPEKMDDGYQTFLSLCSHEYFHTWNVKRIKPAEFSPYQLAAESYSTQLWAYEGITSYYDDLSLARTKLVSIDDYLQVLAKTFSRVYRSKGRLKQTVAQSSFDAWTKFYKQDENAPNAIISYYTKGAMIALSIDLMIRQSTNNQKSLDDVMRMLWQKHGLTGIGTQEKDFITIINNIYPGDISEFLHHAIHTTNELPMVELMQSVGVELTFRAAQNQQDLSGIKTTNDYTPSLGILYKGDNVGVQITHVLDDCAAQKAGLSAKDHILAVDGLKVSSTTLATILAHIPRGQTVNFTLFREDVLMTIEVTIEQGEAYVAQLVIKDQDKVKAWLTAT